MIFQKKLVAIVLAVSVFTINAEEPVYQFENHNGFQYIIHDYCAINGWYGDGICDEGCFNPDPDCEGEEGSNNTSDDFCEINGWYGDGICDEGCLNPDPDCE